MKLLVQKYHVALKKRKRNEDYSSVFPQHCRWEHQELIGIAVAEYLRNTAFFEVV